MKKHLLLFLLMCFVVGHMKLQAQGLQVSGTITDASTGNTLPGVSILLNGSTKGTISDLNGKFTIEVPDSSAILNFSFIGYTTEKIVIGNRGRIDVTLVPDIKNLDEVVVVGYGTAKRINLTGSVASVTEADLKASVVTNVDQAMQGRLAGVQVTQNSGQPGGATSIRVRGTGSINSSNEPLYVIDGIAFQGSGATIGGFDWVSGANGQNKVNPLSTINPADIVQIDVLKDAAAAIYGAQAANGVVLVTTRRGKKGTAQVTFNTYYGVQEVQKKMEVMSLSEYASYENDVRGELGLTKDSRHADPSLLGNGTDWQSAIFRQAAMQNHQIAISGGGDKTTYSLSGGYFKQDGIIIGSNFDRFSGKLNFDSDVKSWLKSGGNISYSRTSEKITLNDGADGVIVQALLMQPDVPVKNFDGTYAGPSNNSRGNNTSFNPVAEALQLNNTLARQRVIGSFYSSAELFKGLTFRSEISFDNSNSINKCFYPIYKFGGIANDVAQLRQIDNTGFYWAWKNYLTYEKTFADVHNFKAMFGSEATKNKYEILSLTKRNFASNDIQVMSQGDDANDVSTGSLDANSLLSYYGRFNYNYDERYLTEIIVRADASSRFGKNNKWGYFPSASFGWRINNEAFLKDVTAISNLKLRFSFMQLGNQEMDKNHLYDSQMTAVTTPLGTGYRPSNIPNPNLKWETSTGYNLGLDLGLLQSRIELTAEIYKRYTKDLLLQLSPPNFLGGTESYQDIAAPMGNVGKIENKGIDILLNTRNIDGKKFKWNSTFTFSLNRNMVKELDNSTTTYYNGLYWYANFGTATRTNVGHPIGVFYGYETEGLFQDKADIMNHAVQIEDPANKGHNLMDKKQGVWVGDVKFKDQVVADGKGDGVIDTKDQVIIGDPNPDFTCGFNNSFTYGPFDLNVFLNCSYGGDILNYTRVMTEGQVDIYSNQSKTITNRAKFAYKDPAASTSDGDNVYLANPGTDIPRPTTTDNNKNNRMSSRFIEDGSFLRVQNVTLAFNVPSKWSQKIKIERLRLYVSGQNLHTFTKYKGFDPEIGAYNQNSKMQNIDMGRYPSPRIYTFGLDVTF